MGTKGVHDCGKVISAPSSPADNESHVRELPCKPPDVPGTVKSIHPEATLASASE